MFKNESVVFYVFVGFIIVICLKVYFESDTYNLKCIIATTDGNRYCVRNREKLNDAANLLASVTNKCKQLVNYMKETHPNDTRVKKLVAGFNPKSISETLPTSELTAYSENKGEKIAFCLNTTKNGDTLIDVNTLTFVAIHELSHIMTTTIGHKQDFWQNFKFLLENAKESNIYIPVDYKKQSTEYCGLTINDNPYYDLK
jgi:WLM domain